MQNDDLLLSKLEVDDTASAHLLEIAKWAKFLSIMGFVFCGLFVVFGLFFGTIMSSLSRNGSSGSQLGNVYGGSMGMVMGVVYIFIALLYFFPCLLLYRFSTKMKIALQSNEQTTLNESLNNLRQIYKFMGILMIVILGFYALVIIGVGAVAMFK